MVSRLVLILPVLGILAACAGGPAKEAEVYRAPSQSPQTPAAPLPRKTDPGVRTASASLRLEAGQASASGDFDRAEALLQRAHRIDPADAEVYLDLAELYAGEGNRSAARTMAERGLLYCDPTNCSRLRDLLGR